MKEDIFPKTQLFQKFQLYIYKHLVQAYNSEQ